MEAIRADIRNNHTGETNKALRRKGYTPAIVYSQAVGNIQVQVDSRELDTALRNQTTNKPFTLTVEGNDYDVMVYELQRHPVQGNVLHVDFKQINMNEKVHTSVPIVFTGDPELGVATLVRHSVEVACLPRDIPTAFSVNVDGLNIGDVVLVKDLDIPTTIDVGLDELEVVVSVLPTKAKSDESVEAQQEAQGVAETADAPVNEAEKV